jgi:hypothetical protein
VHNRRGHKPNQAPFHLGTLGHIRNESISKGKCPNGKYEPPRPCPWLGAIEFLVSTRPDVPLFLLDHRCSRPPERFVVFRRNRQQCSLHLHGRKHCAPAPVGRHLYQEHDRQVGMSSLSSGPLRCSLPNGARCTGCTGGRSSSKPELRSLVLGHWRQLAESADVEDSLRNEARALVRCTRTISA